MLSEVVFILDALGGGGGGGPHLPGEQGHLRHLLQHHRMVHRLGRVFAPGEGPVAGTDHAGDGGGLDAPLLESLDDNYARVFLVILLQLPLGQVAGAGDGAVEVVSVGGAEAGDVLPRLGPGHRVGAVGVDDAPDAGERLVKFDVGLGVAGGLPSALHPFPGLQAYHHHVVGGHAAVLHP